jgi:hypothetical protein
METESIGLPKTFTGAEPPTGEDSVDCLVSLELFEALRNWTATVENIIRPHASATRREDRMFEQLEKYGFAIRVSCPEARKANKQICD